MIKPNHEGLKEANLACANPTVVVPRVWHRHSYDRALRTDHLNLALGRYRAAILSARGAWPSVWVGRGLVFQH